MRSANELINGMASVHSPGDVTFPEIAVIAITRVALGAGIGLLLARRLSDARRKSAGLALLAVGVATTVPLVAELVGNLKASAQPSSSKQLATHSEHLDEYAS